PCTTLFRSEVADGDADDQRDEGGVEDEVPGLLEVPLLRGDGRVVVAGHPEAAPAQDRRRGRADLLEAALDLALGVSLEAGEPSRCTRRLAAQGLEVHRGPRHDAADEGDEEQDVDRREPWRAVDVEGVEAIERRPDGRVAREPRLGLGGVDVALGEDRPGDGADGHEQEQEERGAHARQLPPPPPEVADDPEPRLGDLRLLAPRRVLLRHQRSTSQSLMSRRCNHWLIASQPPVTRSSPMTSSSTAPNTWIARWRRRSHVETGAHRS